MQDHQGSRRRVALWYSPFAMVTGALFALFGSGFHPSVRGLLHGALIGLLCFFGALAGEIIFHRWIEAAPTQWWRRALVYFIGGQIGWPIGLVAGVVLIWRQPIITQVQIPRTVWAFVLVAGVVGTFIGVAAYTYETLKERLRQSIEKIKEKEFAEKELELARALQARMLPPPEIAGDGYRISARNYAARTVAGDFYDIFPFGDGSIGVAVADVAGKGLAASLIMASVKAVLPLLASNRSAGEAMAALNEKLAGELTKREFVALVLARYDPATRRVTLVNAGLPDPYVVRRGGALETIEVTGPRLPLGLRRGIAYEQREIALDAGDALLLYSDGLPEAANADGEQLGYDRLAAIVRATGARVDAILERVHAATTAACDDDQTIVVLECTAEGATS